MPDEEVRQTIVEYLPRLRAIAYKLTRNRALAEDILHTAFIRALTRSDRFAPGTNCRAWITRILVNCFYNDRRTQKRRDELLASLPYDGTVNGGQHERVEFEECRRAWRRLSSKHRQILQMVVIDGDMYERVAEKRGIAVGTVKSRLFRARAQLHHLLSEPRAPRGTSSARRVTRGSRAQH